MVPGDSWIARSAVNHCPSPARRGTATSDVPITGACARMFPELPPFAADEEFPHAPGGPAASGAGLAPRRAAAFEVRFSEAEVPVLAAAGFRQRSPVEMRMEMHARLFLDVGDGRYRGFDVRAHLIPCNAVLFVGVIEKKRDRSEAAAVTPHENLVVMRRHGHPCLAVAAFHVGRVRIRVPRIVIIPI